MGVLVNVEGDHNSRRPSSFFDEVERFFLRTLHVNIESLQKESKANRRTESFEPVFYNDSDAMFAPLPEPEEFDERRRDRLGDTDPNETRNALLALGFQERQVDASL